MKGEEILKSNATYWGGHFLHPETNGKGGIFTITKEKIIFKTPMWKIEIPFKKINWSKVSQISGEDIAYKQKMAAWSWFATGIAVTDYTRKMTFLIIPYKDKKGVKQNPMFSFKKQQFLEQIVNLFYERKTKKGRIREGLTNKEILKIKPLKKPLTKEERRKILIGKIIPLTLIGIIFLPVLIGLIPLYYAYKEWKRIQKVEKKKR